MLRRARFDFPVFFPVFLAGALLLGCGGGSAHKDGGPDGNGSGVGGSGTGGVRLDGGAGTGVGGAGGTATGGTGGLPPAMPTGASVFTGSQAALLDLGPTCTGETGATGDRWCAFLVGVDTAPRSLYVVNVGKAATGTAVTCGLTDANCLLLTATAVEDSFHAALFQGDTLVYYDMTATPFAWRPGMTAGRALAVADPATANVLGCMPSSKGTAVMCIKDLPMAMQTDPTHLIFSDVIAGHVEDAATPPLVRVDTVISFNTAEMNMTPHFELGFPVPGTDAIAWSSRATATGPEVLKMQTIGNDASRVTVASGVNNWTVSPDGARWYWLTGITEATGAGTLQSAPYPAGTSPATMTANAIQYDFPTPSSLLVVDTAKNMVSFANPASAPTVSQPVDTGVIAFVGLSSLGHAAYVKTTAAVNGTTFTDLFVKKGDGTGACTLTSATDGYPFLFIFTPNAGGAIWIQRSAAGMVLAQYTRLSDCALMNVVPGGVAGIGAIGDRAILFADGFSTATQSATVKFRNLAPGNALSAEAASVISGLVGTFAVTPSAGSDLVVYTVNGGGNDDGVYIRSFGP